MQDDHRDSGVFNGDYNSIVRFATLSNSCGFTAAGLKAQTLCILLMRFQNGIGFRFTTIDRQAVGLAFLGWSCI